MILYLYDIKTKNEKEYRKAKRLFYYHLRKSKLNKCARCTKSVLVVQDRKESLADEFFRRFLHVLEVYKVRTRRIEEL